MFRARCTLCRRRHNVHLIRNALRPVARRDAGEVAKELRGIYTAPTAEAAFDALAAFAASPWGKKYPQAAKVFEDAWDAFTPFPAFSPAVRKPSVAIVTRWLFVCPCIRFLCILRAILRGIISTPSLHGLHAISTWSPRGLHPARTR
jgi:hypothetical protein